MSLPEFKGKPLPSDVQTTLRDRGKDTMLDAIIKPSDSDDVVGPVVELRRGSRS